MNGSLLFKVEDLHLIRGESGSEFLLDQPLTRGFAFSGNYRSNRMGGETSCYVGGNDNQAAEGRSSHPVVCREPPATRVESDSHPLPG
jgi:hypothetical protein